jgi:hypothetical protein
MKRSLTSVWGILLDKTLPNGTNFGLPKILDSVPYLILKLPFFRNGETYLAIMGKNAVPSLLAALYFDNSFNKILQGCDRI